MSSTVQDRSSVSANISRRAVQILAEYTGRGPTTAHTVINSDVILILMSDTLTKGERSLAAMGMAEHVLETRRNYQRAMKEELVGIVEEFSGRTVVAFLSENHIDPDLAAEVFVLDPEKAADVDGTNLIQEMTA
jgi:uncharacterized protein YbcI